MRKLLALALAALALAGCGEDDDGGDGTSPAPAPSPEKQAFIAGADTICVKVNREINAINAEIATMRSGTVEEQLTRAAPLFRRSVRIQEQAIENFRALDVPEDDRATIEEYLEVAEDQADALSRAADAAERADSRATRSATAQLEEIATRRRAIIADYGFKSCGGAPSQE